MISDFQHAVLSLIKSALTGEETDLPENLDYDELYNFAIKQQLVGLIFHGLQKNSDKVSKEVINKFFLPACQAISLSHNQMAQLEKLCNLFDENGIEYMPVKGSAIRSAFPKPEMRLMSDLDILIKTEQSAKINAIMEKAGYAGGQETDHEFIWAAKGVTQIELHKCLVSEKNADFYDYYGNGWKFGKKCEGSSTKYLMSHEDMYIYLFVHLTKHFRAGGIGIKHLIDLYVYSTAHKLDKEYINKELEKLGLNVFYSHILRAIDYCFNSGESDDTIDYIVNKFFNNGPYGTSDEANLWREYRDYKLSGSAEQNLKRKRLIKAIFLPKNEMCVKFPILKKAPFLLPFCHIARWIEAIFSKGKIKSRINSINDFSQNDIADVKKELNSVGLDFEVKK